MVAGVQDVRDGITAYITGGLGNQLFVYAAAYEQARRLDCPLFLDASRYIDSERYDYALGGLGLPGEVIGDRSRWAAPESHRRLNRLLKRGPREEYFFHEQGFGYDPRIETTTPGQLLVGYFQAHRYFERSSADLYDRLRSTAQPDASIAVHVRRGDYLIAEHRRHHGLASGDYFARAARLMQERHGDVHFRVFSDSPEMAVSELSRLPFDFEVVNEPSDAHPWEVVQMMSLAQGLIMSNSSFSWWAGWLMRQRDPSARVIAPRPWFATGESAADLLYEDWITVGAR
jgi:hypothetical protein